MNWAKFFKKLLFPPLWLIIILAFASTAGLITVFVNGWESTVLAYITYAVSAYALTVVCVFFVKTFPRRYRTLKQKFYDHPYGNKYMTDVGYKVRVSLYISLTVNLLYSFFKLGSGIYYRSFWWGAIAVYYILLSVIRFLILRYMRSDNQHIVSEWKRYRLCGILTVLLNLSLSGIVFQMVRQNKAFAYPEVIIIASATYTFYTVTMSVIDLVRYRKHNSPVISAAKAIRFAAALVSMLTMETAMLAKYGEVDSFRRIMTAITGSAVCATVLGISVLMIIRATKELKKLKGIKIHGK